MSVNASTLSLSGGEISPLLYNRLDLEKRASALARCSNFIPLPYGGLRKRPGTKYLQTVSNCTGSEVMFPFRGSDAKRYILTFTPTYFHAYDIAGDTLHSQSLTWPITADTLKNLRFNPINDVIFLNSPHITPTQLRYTSATSWAFVANTYTNHPFRDENLDENIKITVLSNPIATTWASGASYTVGQIRLAIEGDREWTCIAAHTSSSTNRPVSGSTYTDFWEPTVYPKGTDITLKSVLNSTAWLTATVYAVGAYVSYLGVYYRSQVAHTSNADTIPGAEFIPGIIWTVLTPPFNALHPADGAIFTPATTFQVRQKRDEKIYKVELPALIASDGTATQSLICEGTWNFVTFDMWSGTFTVQRYDFASATWQDIRKFESKDDRNYAETGTEDTPALIRLRFDRDAGTDSGGNERGILSVDSSYAAGTFTITAVTSTVLATGRTLTLTQSGTTDKWSEGAFNRLRGYPRAAVVHERRLIYAGTTTDPLTLWMSEIEDFTSFRTDSDDSAGLKITLSANNQTPILWLASQRRLYVGTRLSEWVIGSEQNDNPITPTNFLARQYTTYGSSPNTPPILIGDSVVFLQRHDSRLREMAFQADRETYDSTDLMRLAEHLLYPSLRILSMAWQESREPTLWAVISDGTIRTFTYIRSERVFAWSRHSTALGTFQALAISPTDQNDDEVYFLALRNGTYTLEVIPSNAQILNEHGTTNGTATSVTHPAVYDCQQYTSRTPGQTLPTVTAWASSGSYTATSASSSSATITPLTPGTVTASGGTFIGGIPITAEIYTLPLEMDTQTGSSLGRQKHAHKLRASLYLGRNLEAADYINDHPTNPGSTTYVTMQPSKEAPRYYGSHDITTAPASQLYAGWVEANITLSTLNLTAHLRHTAPTPCTITALVIEAEIYQP